MVDIPPSSSLRIRSAAALTIAIAMVIAWGTLSPPGDGGFTLPLTDKQIHALAFAGLVLPLGWTVPRSLFWLAPVALLYGAAIEIVQSRIGRTAEWGDLLADALGIACAVVLCLWHARRRTGRRL